MSLTWGTVPAIDVSGMPTFRGGGGSERREYGWYAELVCIFRFEDMREAWEEEKQRRTCWHGRAEDIAGEEANLYMKLDDDVTARSRWAEDMLKICL